MEQAPARQTNRHQVVQLRDFPFCLIPFKSLVSTVMTAHVINFSIKGAGIESDQRLEPGFVWFRDRIGGCKGGLLVWSRQVGDKYRAGVRFVPLSRDKTGSEQTSDQPSPDDLKTMRSADGTPTEEDLVAQLRDMLSSL